MADRAQLDLDRSTDAAPAPAAKGGIKAFLPLIITILIMPAAAWAMTRFVLIPSVQKSLGVEAPHAAAAHTTEEAPASGGHGKEPAKDSGGAKESVTMTKLLVNVSGTMGSRYLLTSLTLMGNNAGFKAKFEKNEPKLRDMAGTILSTKTIADLEKPGGRNLVRSELLNGFNNVLGANAVQELFITEFAIQ